MTCALLAIILVCWTLHNPVIGFNYLSDSTWCRWRKSFASVSSPLISFELKLQKRHNRCLLLHAVGPYDGTERQRKSTHDVEKETGRKKAFSVDREGGRSLGFSSSQQEADFPSTRSSSLSVQRNKRDRNQGRNDRFTSKASSSVRSDDHKKRSVTSSLTTFLRTPPAISSSSSSLLSTSPSPSEKKNDEYHGRRSTVASSENRPSGENDKQRNHKLPIQSKSKKSGPFIKMIRRHILERRQILDIHHHRHLHDRLFLLLKDLLRLLPDHLLLFFL
jgi:hypothetical protein